MTGLPDRLPAAQRDRLRQAGRAQPTSVRPMLAVLSKRRSFDDGWLFERKLDGVRALAVRDGDRTHLMSRSGQSLGATYPEVVDALAEQECKDFTVDGEIVAMRNGRTDFSLLQRRMQLSDARTARASGVTVLYYVFDLLHLEGWDTTRLPLRTRKSLLRDALSFGSPVRFTPHRNRDGQDLLGQACASGWEGLIAKRADAPYQQTRSSDWLKLKCEAGQEFVIGGFTEPAGSRVGFGALLLGYYDNHGLRYAGKVGTGFERETLLDLRQRLDARRQSHCPFDEPEPPREHGVHWTKPELVAQIGFTEWTRDGKLRHPRFLGLRVDKRPSDVVREKPAA